MSVFQPILEPGLVHTPVTPFTRDNHIDYDTFGKLIEFHLRNGADSLALPMHIGESVSLTDEEQRALLAFAIKQVNGRKPIIAHASDAGSAIAADRARHAQGLGAAAIVATTPYYWTPPQHMIIEHFAAIGSAVSIPFFVYNSPEEMPGSKITAELSLKLIDRLPNFAGVVDLSLDWQFMIELLTYAKRKRPGFALIAGTEHMVSAAAIGATGLFSLLAGVAPTLIRKLYHSCRKDLLVEARGTQQAVAALRQHLKTSGNLKAAIRTMGRDCGIPRPPLQTPDAEAARALAATIEPMLRDEPRGF
jgi:4-hydroxy-tetrahydrodipicolinate synthase